jgi:hypothetical protein
MTCKHDFLETEVCESESDAWNRVQDKTREREAEGWALSDAQLLTVEGGVKYRFVLVFVNA